MSPSEASTLTLIAGSWNAEDENGVRYQKIRKNLLDSLDGEAHQIGKVLTAKPASRNRFSKKLREAAARIERWTEPRVAVGG
ncbi:MAG: hypothetical protein D6696_17340 [Acidobacteria bacterium]|nr:MAG: hypothetical protein D6696_17340 [Acidobacteriota bacterium]